KKKKKKKKIYEFATSEYKQQYNIRYEICHVNELKAATIHTIERSLNDTTVRDLSSLILSDFTYQWKGMQWWTDKVEKSFFQGYPCKPACLFSNKQSHHLMLIDDDILMFENPFSLITSHTYQTYGHILFRDQLKSHRSF
ncbi:hypothetical protein RFI_33504, partial [Reticulomyxa filosa]